MPALCLLGFLMISMIHFGSGDARHGVGWMRGAESLPGGLVVAGISQMHRTEVDVVFGYLVGGDTAFVWSGLDVDGFVGVPYCLRQPGPLVSEMALDCSRTCASGSVVCRGSTACRLCGLFLPCAFSAPCCRDCRQPETLHVCCQFMRPDPGLHAGKLACWRGGRLVVCRHDKPEPTVLRVIFIGLAALTVPHMILVDGFYRRSSKSLKRHFISR